MQEEIQQQLSMFIDNWEETSEKTKEVFLYFKEYLNNQEGVTLDFISRPGLTYSLRAVHATQQDKGLFVMVDVIEDVSRWLSICFYKEMVTDPEEKGDFVPQGLLGEDALCFDLEKRDEALIRYIQTRLDEAYQYAKGL